MLNPKTTVSAVPRRRPLVHGSFRTMAAALLLLGLTAGPASAADPEAVRQGAKVLQDLGSNVDATLRDGSLSKLQRRRRLGHLLIARFDLDKMSRNLLTRHWETASRVDRTEFRRLLGLYIIASFGRYFETAPGLKLRVMNMRPKGDSDLRVRSLLDLGPKLLPLDISWRLNRRNHQAWRIVDVVVRGFSLVTLLRAEFSSVIEADDGQVKGLLSKLREKTAAIDSGA